MSRSTALLKSHVLTRRLKEVSSIGRCRDRIRTLCSTRLEFDKFGQPLDVLEKRTFDLPDAPAAGEVLVRMLASPINPSDINTIEGVYPIKPKGFPPGVPGNEGVGEVLAVGDGVTSLTCGDWVIPSNAGLWGSWSAHVLQPWQDFLRIPNDIPLMSAATVAVNPCTAYRMLSDFASLCPGDAIVQNGANSAVGQAVIQIARRWGLKSVNVVRDRKDLDVLKCFLTQLGADVVVTDSELREPSFRHFLEDQRMTPSLGFDCVGGKNASNLLRILQPGGTMVTYGAMSRQPMQVPASALIFKDYRIRGFWMSEWNKRHRGEGEGGPSQEMLTELCQMIRDGELAVPRMNSVPFQDFRVALQKAMTSLTTEKQVLVF